MCCFCVEKKGNKQAILFVSLVDVKKIRDHIAHSDLCYVVTQVTYTQAGNYAGKYQSR